MASIVALLTELKQALDGGYLKEPAAGRQSSTDVMFDEDIDLDMLDFEAHEEEVAPYDDSQQGGGERGVEGDYALLSDLGGLAVVHHVEDHIVPT